MLEKLKNDITILKNQSINGKEMNILDLDKIFMSLIDNEYAKVIINNLKALVDSQETVMVELDNGEKIERRHK